MSMDLSELSSSSTSAGSSSMDGSLSHYHHQHSHQQINYNNDRFEGDEPTQQVLRLKLSDQICHRCGFLILDRHLLRVTNNYYHEACLRCVQCDKPFIESDTCFIKANQVFCKEDYLNNFIRKCARCLLPIRAEEYVQKCREHAYHSSCFYCIYCGKSLKIGDEYYCVDAQIICSNDYQFMLQQGHQPGALPLPPPGSLSDLPFPPLHPLPPFFPEMDGPIGHHRRNSSKKPPKRPRTILNSIQRKAFKIAFDKGSKPTKKVREQLASETGLSVRVVQVWFQNQRAKIKKIQRKQGIQNCDPSMTESGLSPDSKSDDLKSPSSSKFMDDSDLEDIDVDSGRSSSATIQRQNSSSSFFSSDMTEKDPMEKLYHMSSTYFAFA